MLPSRQDYDQDVNTFTPEGRVLQVEYAVEASKLGATSIGICTSQGVILAAEKRQASPLMVAGGLERIVELDSHVACTMAGMTADARSLIEPARMECSKHWFNYNEHMPLESLVQSVAQQAHEFGKGGDAGNDTDSDTDSDSDSDDGDTNPSTRSRPYGVALLFAGVDNEEPQLWHLEPSGEVRHLAAKAIGSGGDAAQLKLLEHYKAGMELKEAMFLALSILEGAMGRKLTSSNLELLVVTKEAPCHKFSKAELELEIANGSSITNDTDPQ